MPLLDAILAFSLTMLLLSTIVERITGLGLRLKNTRNDGARKLLTEFFEKDFTPVIHRNLKKYGGKLESGAAARLESKLQSVGLKDFFSDDDLDRIAKVSGAELLERVKRSELGKELAQELKEDEDKVIQELADRFSSLGQRYSEAFRSHSRLVATTFGIALAVLANVDSMRLANAYMNQDGASQAAISLQNSFVTDYQALASVAETDKDSALTREQVIDAFSKSKASLEEFRPTKIPIGWGYFPYNPDDDLLSPNHKRHIHWGSWLAGCVLTGVLAGFGAGFWYDAVVGVSKFRDRARGTQQTDAQTS